MRGVTGLLACIVLAASVACTNQEGIATSVATDWVTDSVRIVSDEFVKLVLGEVPVLGQLAAGVLADRIQDTATWQYSIPKCGADDRCELTATASVTIDVSLPLVGDKTYAASLPFDLQVDTNRRMVERWVPDVLAASVRESR